VLSDFDFCKNIISKDGIILFHDFWIIYPAVAQIIKNLKKDNRQFAAVRLGGTIAAICFFTNIVAEDSVLKSISEKKRYR